MLFGSRKSKQPTPQSNSTPSAAPAAPTPVATASAAMPAATKPPPNTPSASTPLARAGAKGAPAAAVAAAVAPVAVTAASTGDQAGTLSPEEMKRRADYSHGLLQAFGAIVAVYMRSKAHREMRLCDIETVVGAAVSTGQFSLAEATHKQNGIVTPIAAVLWASVSPAIDARISAEPGKPFALTPPDWKSGETIWLIEAIGDQQMLGSMLQRLQTTVWKGRTVKMRAQGEGGRIVAQTLTEKMST